MKYNELPKWAQKEVFNWAKQQYLDLDEETMREQHKKFVV